MLPALDEQNTSPCPLLPAARTTEVERRTLLEIADDASKDDDRDFATL
jgi:hypothetical protein